MYFLFLNLGERALLLCAHVLVQAKPALSYPCYFVIIICLARILNILDIITKLQLGVIRPEALHPPWPLAISP